LTVAGYGVATLQDYQAAQALGLAYVTTDRPVEIQAWKNEQTAKR
jgi:glycerophosphoryl diester phosphodiesterase